VSTDRVLWVKELQERASEEKLRVETPKAWRDDVIARFASPFLSCIEGLFPFPYADLSSLFDKSRSKNKHFSTYTCPISYIASVYTGCSTTARIHRNLCQKIQKWSRVSMSRQEISDP
jgi:hypothetical protein